MSRQNVGRKEKKDDTQINDEIYAKELRVVSEGAGEPSIMSKDDALKLAESQGLDLVVISPDAQPPVAKIMDYGKYRYEMEKRKKEARKNQKIIDIKEIKFSCKIAENDIAYKVKHAREFLEKEKHVKLRVFLKGREMASPELGVNVLKKVWPMLEDIAVLEKDAHQEGRYVTMYLTPKKK